jgi:hypothetical protein
LRVISTLAQGLSVSFRPDRDRLPLPCADAERAYLLAMPQHTTTARTLTNVALAEMYDVSSATCRRMMDEPGAPVVWIGQTLRWLVPEVHTWLRERRPARKAPSMPTPAASKVKAKAKPAPKNKSTPAPPKKESTTDSELAELGIECGRNVASNPFAGG